MSNTEPTIQEAAEVVRLLNTELENLGFPMWMTPLVVATDGVGYGIKFLDMINLYDNEDDTRKWDDEKEDYEPLEGYIRRVYNTTVQELGKYKLKEDIVTE